MLGGLPAFPDDCIDLVSEGPERRDKSAGKIFSSDFVVGDIATTT